MLMARRMAPAGMSDRIAAYLQAKLPAARDLQVRRLFRIPGGASRETWSFDARWSDDGESHEQGFILRADPEASLLDSNRNVEFRVYQALQDSGVPVPRVCWDEPDSDWIGRPFFVMHRLEGETAPSNLMSPRWAPLHDRIGRQLAEHLARIHGLDWRARGLDFLGLPESARDCAVREVDRWVSLLKRDALEPQPVLNLAVRWLRRNLPVAQRVVLVHGDYRTGNYLYGEEGIRALFDWEMTHLGDPLEDVGWTAIRYWRYGGTEKIGGVIDREAFYQAYETAGGTQIDRDAVHFWEVLGNLKMAVISLTGARSFCDRRTHDLVMAYVGRSIPRLEAEIMHLLER
ncbi:MAG: phosphotransferase family protein [Dehalococcoidia bacterium]